MGKRNDRAAIELATARDREELLDFLHRVFSSENPSHPRFERLYPDLFPPTDEAMGRHAVLRIDGRIAACVGAYPEVYRTSGYDLKAAVIGQVATDPACQGRGYMGRLMRFQLERLKEAGVIVAWLGGRHDRYARFGFEMAGLSFCYSLDDRSLRSVPVARTTRRICDDPAGAVTRSMFERLLETSPAVVVESIERFRARLARAGCEIWTSTPPGALEPEAWAVISPEWKKIDVVCGSTEGLLEIAKEACRTLGPLAIDIPAASRELGDGFRAHCRGMVVAMVEMTILDLKALGENFRRQGWRGPLPDGDAFGKGEAERLCFGPEPRGDGGPAYPLTIPFLYHA